MAKISDLMKEQIAENGAQVIKEGAPQKETHLEEKDVLPQAPLMPPISAGTVFSVREKPVMCYHIRDPKYPHDKASYPDCLYEMLENEGYVPAIGSKAIIYEYKLWIGKPSRWEPQTVYERRLDGWQLVESKVKV